MISLFEVANNVRPEIKLIHKTFSEIKERNKYNALDIISLTSCLERIFKCKFNIEFIPNEWNAYVLPFYESKNKEITIDNKTPVEISSIMKTASEINIWFGIPFLKDFTSGELTAILLHELGHVYIDSTTKIYMIAQAIDTFFISILEFISSILGAINLVTLASGGDRLIKPVFSASLCVLIYALKLPCRICSRKNEKLADNYAVKMGYGDELISAFMKLDKETSKDIGFFTKLKRFVISFLFLNTHPNTKDRVNTILKDIEKDYSDKYPNVSKNIEKVFEKYNKQLYGNV